MLDDLFKLSQEFLRVKKEEYKRYFYYDYQLNNRFSIIIGSRGVGKTVFILQYVRNRYGETFTDRALYVPADHFLVGGRSIYEIAEEFYKLGGELICFDEIHKYSDWSKELKSIYDTFPDLKIIASGSSSLEISKGTNDLSRRAVVYTMNGMSFREFIELFTGAALEKYSLQDIIGNHQNIAELVISKIEGKILKLFKMYLEYGYYPYFKELNNIDLYYLTLEQNVRTTLENDLISIYPNITGITLKKIKKLLTVISQSVPFTPDLKNLKTLTDVGDERTLKTYLKYLDDAGIISSFSKTGRGLKELEKPEKIYMNNTNLIYALSSSSESGNIRETFFSNQVSAKYDLRFYDKADFLVDSKYIFEVGGKNKDFNQIKDLPDSFIALDEIEIGFKNRIPLWLFGFLY